MQKTKYDEHNAENLNMILNTFKHWLYHLIFKHNILSVKSVDVPISPVKETMKILKC